MLAVHLPCCTTLSSRAEQGRLPGYMSFSCDHVLMMPVQLIEVAEHPVPPYAWPGNTSRPTSNAGGSPRDVELGRPGAAAGAADGSNPFVDGLAPLSAAQDPQQQLQRQAGSGGSGGASLGLQHPGGAAVAADTSTMFGGRGFIDDDDPLSPTWSMLVRICFHRRP
jgi:hypothetical protein